MLRCSMPCPSPLDWPSFSTSRPVSTGPVTPSSPRPWPRPPRTEGRASWFALADPARLTDLLETAETLLAASGASLSLKAHRDHAELEEGEL